MKQIVSWPGWDVLDCIGTGGFGSVYEIRREIFGDVERCALKVITIPKDAGEIEYMRCEGMDDESITNTLHTQVGDIVREYKLMARMRENPNIVHCDDFRYTRHETDLGWDIYIKMELLTPLLKVMDRVQDESEIIRLGIELCNALAACQKHNVIHRDIKPQNIFVSPEGYYKLGDFGIARTMEHTTKATVGIGTYNFMAPEVALGKTYGPAVDIYSLGLVLYWLLNERRGPFVPLPPAPVTYAVNDAARSRRYSGEPIPEPKHGSQALKAVVLKACAFDPQDRYQTAREMMEALKNINTNSRIDSAKIAENVEASNITEATPLDSNDQTILEKQDLREEPNRKQEALRRQQEDAKKQEEEELRRHQEALEAERKQQEELRRKLMESQEQKLQQDQDERRREEQKKQEVEQLRRQQALQRELEKRRRKEEHEQEEMRLLEEQQNNLLQKQQAARKMRLLEDFLFLAGIVAAIIIAVLLVSNGGKKTGWYTNDGAYYYYGDDGVKRTGWALLDGKKYYFDADGRMTTGWTQLSGNTYYFHSDGTPATGLLKLSGNTYYFHPDGTAATGWETISGDTYYLSSTGEITTGSKTIDGVLCTFDSSGKLIQKVRKLMGNEIPSTTESKDETFYKKNSGKTGKGRYQVLSEPINNCNRITVRLSVSDYKYGNIDNWGFYIRDLSGTWVRIGDIPFHFLSESNSGNGAAPFTFDEPVSFDAYVCLCESLESSWSFAFSQSISDICVIESP